MSTPVKSSPKDAQVMAAILKDMGVLESEPRLINQMLEFTYRYVTDVLDDAKVFSSHASRKAVEAEDVKLAVQIKTDHSFTTPPPKDLLLDVARQKNSQPLPLVKPYAGPRLPPDRYCLTAPNYRLKTLKKSQARGGQYGPALTQHKMGLFSQVKAPLLGSSSSLTKALPPQPSLTLLNNTSGSSSSTSASGGSISGGASVISSRPTIRVTPGTGVGVSGLSRVVSGQTGASLTPAISTLPSVTSDLGGGSNSNSVVNPLKRKLDDDDDYDV